jgi:DNA-binding GntR family transcriptional regulator
MRPDYVIIADDLRLKITNSEIGLNEALPSQQALREAYDTSLATAKKALNVLKAQGYAAATLGRGTYVISTRPTGGSRDDDLRMLDEVHRRLDVLEDAIRELSTIVRHGGGYQPQAGTKHA